jgi:undecaprenyl diphosphate synthase
MRQDRNSDIPVHVAIVMDGNGRWAKSKGLQRVMGHRNAVEAVRAATEAAAENGVKYLTLYAFSTENWQRPKEEVEALMSLLVDAVEKEEPKLQKNNVRLISIGNTEALPKAVAEKFNTVVKATSKNTGLTLVVALSYSGRWEITDAAKRMCEDVASGKLRASNVTEEKFAGYLQSSAIPDPDLFIRTGGDLRISNFLLWQAAYAEFYFPKVLWPDFRKEHFLEAMAEFKKRERRFGKV